MSEKTLGIGLRVIALTMLTLGCAFGCSDWDAAVGVRCSDYPSFCRRGEVDSGGASVIDGGVDGSAEVDASNPRAKTISFRTDIRPLMDRAETDPRGPGCSACHYRTRGTQQGINEGQLDLTTLGTLRRGGKIRSHRRPGEPRTVSAAAEAPRYVRDREPDALERAPLLE